MLTFAVAMGCILLLAADLAYFTKKRQELVLPLGFCLICVWEYIFGLLGLLSYSVLLFIVLLVSVNVFLICRIRPAASDITKFFTPGIIIYILCGIAFTIFYWNKITVGGDEYSAWAITEMKERFEMDKTEKKATVKAFIFKVLYPIIRLFLEDKGVFIYRKK